MRVAPHTSPWRRAACGLAIVTSLAATGCQVDVAGQTLPSGYWMFDDVQYFPPGPEMKVEREAMAQRAFMEQQIQLNAKRDTQTRVR